MLKLFRKLMCKLGYHRINGYPGHIGVPGNYDYYLICLDCHYHIANIKIK